MPNLNSNLNASSYLTSRARVHFHPANWSLLFICRAFKAISRASLAFLSADLFLLSLCFSLMFTIIIESCTESGRASEKPGKDIVTLIFHFRYFLPCLCFASGECRKHEKCLIEVECWECCWRHRTTPTFSVSLSSPISDIHFFLHKM